MSRALARLRDCPDQYMGLNTAAFAEQFTQWLIQRPGAHILFMLSEEHGRIVTVEKRSCGD